MKSSRIVRPFLYNIVFWICFLWCSSAVCAADSVSVSISGYFDYRPIEQVLEETNKIRARVGAPQLFLDEELTRAAMQRAAEVQLIFEHQRPDGSLWSTVSPKVSGENITAGEYTAADAVKAWRESEGHYRNMINDEYISIGIGCFYQNDVPFWVQLFGTEPASENPDMPQTLQKGTAEVRLQRNLLEFYSRILCKGLGNLNARSIEKGGTAQLELGFFCDELDEEAHLKTFVVKEDQIPVINLDPFQVTSSNSKVLSCTASGKITAKSRGTAQLNIRCKARPDVGISCNFTVTDHSCRIKLDANGGYFGTKKSVITKTVSVISKKTYGALASPVRKGYSFSGWYTKKTGGSKIRSSSRVNLASGKSQTLYAHWKKISVPKASIRRVSSPAAGKLTVSLKKISGVSGYELSVSTSKKFTGASTKKVLLKKASKTSYTFTGLAKGKKYYVRIRAYQTDSAKKNVYGKYSAQKSVTVRKK